MQRLGIKSKSHLGQRKIFFVLDRATRRFHGDIGLWIQYIEFAKKEGASRVLLKVFASYATISLSSLLQRPSLTL